MLVSQEQNLISNHKIILEHKKDQCKSKIMKLVSQCKKRETIQNLQLQIHQVGQIFTRKLSINGKTSI